MTGTLAALALLWVGVVGKLVRYLIGPHLTPGERARDLDLRLKRLRGTVTQAEEELDRIRSNYIEVAKLNALSPSEGIYFIDYQMRPGLAFSDDDGLPILLSAKCTHLGCTVGNKVDDQNRILCPCHLSYFDITTGKPNPGSPAKLPLPHIAWVLRDSSGAEVAWKRPNGTMQGKPDMDKLDSYTVFIAKKFEEAQA